MPRVVSSSSANATSDAALLCMFSVASAAAARKVRMGGWSRHKRSSFNAITAVMGPHNQVWLAACLEEHI